ncbi:MAG: hypothetical protein ACF8SC_07075 [Phycisphaerales bacterium JB037]
MPRANRTGRVGIEVGAETETPRGWTYAVRIERGDDRSDHEVHLSWADHDHWCGGARPPSKLVEYLLRWLLEREPDRVLPARFDAATIRRWRPEVDDEIAL